MEKDITIKLIDSDDELAEALGIRHHNKNEKAN